MLTSQERDWVNAMAGNNLDIFLTEFKRHVDEQLTEVAGLNQRASAGLTSGSIVTALTGLQGVVHKAPPSADVTTIHHLTNGTLWVYIVVFLITFLAYRRRSFYTGSEPDKMATMAQAQYNATLPSDEIKREIARELLDGFKTNKTRIRWKVGWTWLVFAGLGAEAVLLTVVTYLHLRLLL